MIVRATRRALPALCLGALLGIGYWQSNAAHAQESTRGDPKVPLVAVAPFQYESVGGDFAQQAEAAFSRALQQKWPSLVGPGDLALVSATGCDTIACWMRAAQRVGTEKLIVGKLHGSSPQSVRLSLRAIDIGSGHVVFATSIDCNDCDRERLYKTATSLAEQLVRDDRGPPQKAQLGDGRIQFHPHEVPMLRNLQSFDVVDSGIVVRAQLRLASNAPCVAFGDSVDVSLKLEAFNGETYVNHLIGDLTTVVRLADTDIVLLDERRHIEQHLGTEIQPDGFSLHTPLFRWDIDWQVEVAERGPLEIEVGWNGALLLQGRTRPTGRAGYLRDIWVTSSIADDMQTPQDAVTIIIEKTEVERDVEVVVRAEPRVANVLLRKGFETQTTLSETQVGTFEIQFGPIHDAEMPIEVQNTNFEIWIDGCRVYNRTPEPIGVR